MAKLRDRKTKTVADDKAMGLDGQPFTWTVSEDMAGFTSGDTLSLDRQLVDYAKALFGEYSELELTLSDAEILRVVKAAEVADLDPGQADNVVVEDLEELQNSKDMPLADNRTSALIAASDPSSLNKLAEDLGSMIDEAFDTKVNAALEGKKTWDGAPLTLLPELVRIYGEKTLRSLPVVGTRKQGKKNKKGQFTDNVPDGYNRPTDYFAKTVEGETKYFRFANLWVDSMAHVRQMNARRRTIKMILDREEGLSKIGIPIDLAALVNKVDGGTSDQSTETSKLQALYDDLSADITNYHTRTINALAVWQKIDRLEDEFPNIRIEFANDDNPVLSSRLKNPIILKGRVETKNRKGEIEIGWEKRRKPISIGSFLRLKLDKAKEIAGPAKGGVTLAHLEKASERGTKKTTPTPNQQGAAVALDITNLPLFGDVLASVQQFIDRNDSSIKRSFAGPEAGLYASRIRTAYDLLSRYAEDKTVITLAEAYDTEQNILNAKKRAGDAAAMKAEEKTEAELRKAS